MSMIAQFTFKVLPGKDMVAVIDFAKIAGRLWTKHGGEPELWAVSAGELGTMMFTVRFDDFAHYGKCYDGMMQDPEFRQWQFDSVKMGLSEWVRSNLARQIRLE